MKSVILALFVGASAAQDTSAAEGKVGVCYDSDASIIADCQCHETCGDCGNWSSPVYNDDCIDCQEGYSHFPVYSDGTGECLLEEDDIGMEAYDG